MSSAAAPSPSEILEVAQSFGVTRESVQAQLEQAEREGELDEEPTLNAMRALLAILQRAEGK
jgi:hypothetical protein